MLEGSGAESAFYLVLIHSSHGFSADIFAGKLGGFEKN